jgi:glycosyltransferase involved in cell wall biosynthesis
MMKPDAQPLISVLTPVYNGEKYLSECIGSVLSQTYQNWEYSIFNNCSTDRTLEIAQAYAEKDKRIRVLTNSQFVNRLQNHNIAFRHMPSNSKYCKVVHADDWLFPECIMKMVELAEAHPTVAIVGAYGLRNDRVSWDGLPYPSTVVPGKQIGKSTLLGGPYVFGSPTSLLVRCDEIRRLHTPYNEANQHADKEICFAILRDRDFGFVHQVLTFTREHSEAASAFSRQFYTYFFGELQILTRYGRAYLTAEEYEQQLRLRWKRYYAYLGSQMFLNFDRRFWRYHRDTLNTLGYPLSAGKVAKAAVAELLDLALNPLETSMRISRKIKRSWTSST